MARVTLLQIDFPFSGPWGKDGEEALRGLAEDIAKTDGLRWKIWTENEATGRAGGIYLFDDETSARQYLEMHAKRLPGFGITDYRAELFGVNEGLTRINDGPIG